MEFKHHDEARKAAIEALIKLLAAKPASRAVLIDDLYGKYRLILWPDTEASEDMATMAKTALAAAAGNYWADEIWMVTAKTSEIDRRIYEGAWEEARICPTEPHLRISDRHRRKTAWFKNLSEPPWKVERRGEDKRPPIVVFYSFKGGAGRTTCLASFALRRARAGERVVVVDGDLDAPGVGNLLSPDEPGTNARWGVVDYLLERPDRSAVDLSDYYHSLRREPLVDGKGEIIVFPAGVVNEDYLGKLARLDFEPSKEGLPVPWHHFLEHIRDELKPDWMLVDSRAGLGEAAGLLLGGMGHLHVLFGTSSEQSWQGLNLVIDKLGAERVRYGKPQAECLLVQSMVSEDTAIAKTMKEQFGERAEDEFEARYYAEDPVNDTEDVMWYLRDKVSKDAPHRPVAISYRQGLAHFAQLDDVVSYLRGDEYQIIEQRICERFSEDKT